MPSAAERAQKIRLVCFDVDGTLTDGRLYFDSQGGEIKCFHVHDGQGLRLLEDAGIRVALITARKSNIVQARGKDLRLHYVFDGVADKSLVLQQICSSEKLSLLQTAYMGDDYPDLASLQQVGLSACPADAMAVVKSVAHWHSRLPGGMGAAREFCDFILAAQAKTPVIGSTPAVGQ